MTRSFYLSASEERLIVKRVDEPSVTKGGIHIPDNAKGKSTKATKAEVIDVGPSGFHHNGGQAMPPMPWRAGQIIYISAYTGIDLELEEGGCEKEKFVVICRDDVLATERLKK